MEALTLLTSRKSSSQLTEPAPNESEARAPDHGRLNPTRFIAFRGEDRFELAEYFLEGQVQRDPGISASLQHRAYQAALRAPLIIVVISRHFQNVRIPQIEQQMSSASAAYAILLAAYAQGYGAIWRTGPHAYEPTVRTRLGVTEGETIAGFLYIGTPEKPCKKD